MYAEDFARFRCNVADLNLRSIRLRMGDLLVQTQNERQYVRNVSAGRASFSPVFRSVNVYSKFLQELDGKSMTVNKIKRPVAGTKEN